MKKEVEQAYKQMKHCFDNEEQIKKVDGTWYFVKDGTIKGIVPVNTILKALTSNVSEEVISDIVLYASMVEIVTISGLKGLTKEQQKIYLELHKKFKTLNDVKDVPFVSPQSLEELKQEIIDELNEYFDTTLWDYKNGIFTLNTRNKWEIFIGDLGEVYGIDELPLKLAHKITTYFMRLENENE